MAAQPIIKLLTGAGIGSRRKLTAMIKRGGIAVNGEVVQSFNHAVDPVADVITIDGKRVSVAAEPPVYLMLNKPAGLISSTGDTRGERTVLDILPPKYRSIRLYPVGRLDKDSTGLVLLTNDGDLTFRMTHPRFEQEKEYTVRIDQELKPEDRTALEHGVSLDDGRTSPAKVGALRYPPLGYSVTIHEGRKRQVRRMFASLGYRVLELKRVRFGSLRLGTLAEGDVRELTRSEIRSLKVGRRK
jgi:23S rRNA pseudouridine2605 synthase